MLALGGVIAMGFGIDALLANGNSPNHFRTTRAYARRSFAPDPSEGAARGRNLDGGFGDRV